MTEVKEDILSVFDIEEFVVNFMTANKELLNKVFIQCGWDELCFIRDCGAVLGGLFGEHDGGVREGHKWSTSWTTKTTLLFPP